MYVVREVLIKGRTTCLQYNPRGGCKKLMVNSEGNTEKDAILDQLKKNA